MKVRFLILPALMATALFAQNRGFGPRGSASSSSTTPPTPAQLATREVQMVATYLGLDASQTSTLVNNTTLASELGAEQTTLQTNRASLKTAYTALGTSIASAPATPPTSTVSEISTLEAANLQARVTAAGQVVTALAPLGLTSTQQGKVATLVQRLVDGGLGGGFGGFRR